jgi:hypothetical protein
MAHDRKHEVPVFRPRPTRPRAISARRAARRVARLSLVLLAVAGGPPAAAPAETIVLKPGQDIGAIAARSPQGTRFQLRPGIYRRQTISPRDGQSFIGEAGVILSGALPLESWTRRSGYWQSGPLPAALPFHGECARGRELCARREDLFVDGRPYQRVGSLARLGPGRWYYADRRAHLSEDPAGRAVELGVTPRAFGGKASNVLLQGLIIEKYASDAQEGAIFTDEASGWRIVDVTARRNHGAGLSFGPGTQVSGGSFSQNGQIGIAGSGGAGSRIDGVEIAYNNYAGYDPKWEAGGAKFWATRGLIVRNSCVHHNAGPGLWTDNDNINTTYVGNKVFLNADDGIKHEISYAATISNNVVARNGGGGFDGWLWGSQILLQNSSDARVFGNLVEVSGQFGNGIGIIHQDRGRGAYGPWLAAGNSIYGNTIVHLGGAGQSGLVTDTGSAWLWREGNNSFDRNTYVVTERQSQHWTSRDRDGTWDDRARLGLEPNGRLIVERRAPMRLSCAP